MSQHIFISMLNLHIYIYISHHHPSGSISPIQGSGLGTLDAVGQVEIRYVRSPDDLTVGCFAEWTCCWWKRWKKWERTKTVENEDKVDFCFFFWGGGEFDNQDFPLSSLDYPTCVSKHKMHFPFRIEDKKWQCVISIGPSKLEFHTYTFACMCVTYIHIIDACIYLRVDTHRETERLHVLTLVLTPNIGVGQPHLARFDCLAVGRAKSCSNLVVRRHVFVERSVGYYVKNVGLFLLHSSFGIWEVINIKVFGEVHQIQFR